MQPGENRSDRLWHASCDALLVMLGLRWTLQSRPHPQNRNAKAKSKSQTQRVSRSCFCPGERSCESQIHRECCKPAAPMSRYHRKWTNAGSGHGGGATSKAEARHDSPIGAAAAPQTTLRRNPGPSFRATRAPLPSDGGTLARSSLAQGCSCDHDRGCGLPPAPAAWPKSGDATNAITSLDRSAEPRAASGRGRVSPRTAPSGSGDGARSGRYHAGSRGDDLPPDALAVWTELIIGQPNPCTKGDERRIGGAELDLPLRHFLIAAVFNLS